jgi:hypothetical protein
MSVLPQQQSKKLLSRKHCGTSGKKKRETIYQTSKPSCRHPTKRNGEREMSKSNSLKSISTAEVWAIFKAALTHTAEGYRTMAQAWCELKERGEDLSAYSNPLLSMLPLVNVGALMPEMMVKYAGYPTLLRYTASLVPEEQTRLVDMTDTLPVLVTLENGETVTKSIRPIALSAPQLRQVFGDGRIRTPTEQKRHMPTPPRAVPASPAAAPTASFNLLPALDDAQAKTLIEAAARDGLSIAELVVRFLIIDKRIPKTRVRRKAA